jgi:putative ABC transport system permease protein
LKIKSTDLAPVIHSVKDVYGTFSNGQPLSYSFLDEDIEKVYIPEMEFRSLFLYFSSIAIVIALMGISGLTLLTVVQKRKEIAIRKVLGANIQQVIYKVAKQFILWILLSNLIAWPIAYIFINKWLEQFAFKAAVSSVYFILASLIALLTALLVTGYHTIKAANENPVKNLRYE